MLQPDTRRDRSNRWVPREPGCEPIKLRVVAKNEPPWEFRPKFLLSGPGYPPPATNGHSHEHAIPPRACKECHPKEEADWKTIRLFGNVQPDRGDWWRREAADHPSQAAKARWAKDHARWARINDKVNEMTAKKAGVPPPPKKK